MIYVIQGRARLILTHQARFKIYVFEISMSIKIQEFSQKILMSIKIQDFPEQSLEFKQDPRMDGNLEFEQDSRLYLYLKEYQIKCSPQNPFLHYHYIQTSQIDFLIAP